MKSILLCLFIAMPFLVNAKSKLTSYPAFNAPLNSNSNMVLNRKEPIPDNLWGIDFSLIGISGHYARRVGDELFLGAEGGGLPERFDWVIAGGKITSQENTIWSKDKSVAKYNDLLQLIFCHFYARWKPDYQWIEIDGGFRWAIFDRQTVIPGFEADLHFDRFLGAYLKPTIGLKRIKIGFRLEAGYIRLDNHGNEHEFVSIISPSLRYNFR